MQRLSGFMVLLAGAALGVYSYLPASQDAEEKLAEVTRISAAPDRTARGATVTGTSLLSSLAQSAANRSGSTPAASVAQTGTVTFDAAKQAGTWTTVVTAERAIDNRLSSSKPGDSETRTQLARDLQRELKRVGCYGGEITGSWTPSTKRAMSAFMDRVNATLPVEEPDYILLTLVQGQVAAACGAECPPGQALSDGGRCVPNAVVAQASRKTQREEQRRIALERKASEERQVAEGRKAAEIRDAEQKAEAVRTAAAEDRRIAQERQALGEQKLAEARKASAERRIADARAADAKLELARKAEALSQKRVTVATAERETLPWMQEQQAGAAARSAPLPGMMSVGGPQQPGLDKPMSTTAVDAASRPQIPAGQEIQTALAAEAGQSDIPDGATAVAGNKFKAKAVAARPVKAQTTHRQADRATVSRSHTHTARVIRRPPPAPVFVYRAPRQRSNYYASDYTRSRRYYMPRSGAGHYNLMQSLGGIY